MTAAAAWHTVTSPFGLCVLAAYALLVVLVLGANFRAHRKPTPQRDHVFRIVSCYPPPVPESDAEWLAAWPSAVDDDALCDAEFVSLINSNFYWPWPDSEDAA
jgi:hypothetical protein